MTDLPPILIDAVRDQRAVLFFGSGANHGAGHPKNDSVPLGNDLRDLICDKFFGGSLKTKPLTAVSAMAANEAGLSQFQRYVYELFEPFQPGSAHMLLPRFRWKALATTNYDLIVERAYENSTDRLQNLVVTVKDRDNLDTRVTGATSPLPFYKLHGSIDHHADADIPLILSNEQYASFEENRLRLWSRFRDLAYEYPIIFAGYSISDPHVQRLLFDLTSPKIGRPMFFSVGPNVDPIESRYWAAHRVTCIDSTLDDFLKSLDNAIPTLARKLPATLGGGALSIRSHYRIASATESSELAAYLETDATHVFAGMAAAAQDPKEFYRGKDTGWGCIQQNLDAKRAFADSVLVDAILVSEESSRPAELFMLKGPAGNGKSVSLKRIAWEAAVNYEQIVLFSNNAAGLRVEPLEEIHRLTGKRVVLCVDHVALYRNEALALLRASRQRSLPISILGAERDNEWFTYCDQLEPYLTQEFAVRYLSEREIEDLLALLDRHNALGVLKEQDYPTRLHAFTKNAERQLLVALYEATFGISFEDIIQDEFARIEPRQARDIYLSICALHQFGAPVRAGLISRTSGVSFEQFGREFLRPLMNVVMVVDDEHSGDFFYRSRHQHVAEIVFRRALPSPEEKFDLLAALISAINVSYSSDRETFSRLIKGRGIAELFPNADLGRLFYDRLEQAAPDDPYVFHQRAVFELNHTNGSLGRAEEAARRAFELNSHSRGIRHTQGEVARRLANATDDPLKKEALRKITREKIGGDLSRMSEYDLFTRARLAIDELKEELERSGTGPEVTGGFTTSVHDAETIIQRALQSYPESAELLSVDATFRDVLNQSQAAQVALEKAFRHNPRQDWLAARLARRYADAGEFAKAVEVLDICLRDNPSSKIARFSKAKALMGARENPGAILDNLKRSFSDGDNNYEAQFWYARELFIQSEFEPSRRMFGLVNSRAPGRFRNGAGARIDDQTGQPTSYNGRVERLEEGYAFIRIAQFPIPIFAFRGDSDMVEWSTLKSGLSVRCSIAFARRGPRAINVVRAQA